MTSLPYDSRRSCVVAPHAAVSCSQPLAAQAGLEILHAGGNAADAAVAVAATLGLTMPNSTGLGGDAFCLFYDAKTRKVRGLNGSGRCPAAMTLDALRVLGFGPGAPMPYSHGLTVTVPGAAAAWVDTVQHFGSGKVGLDRILRPAIDLASQGFPVSQLVAHAWISGSALLTPASNPHGGDLLVEGRAPHWGERFTNMHLAQVMKDLAEQGAPGYYSGRVAGAVVDTVRAAGGLMTPEDLTSHTSSQEDPISTDYKGVRLWEIPPNGQGIVALMVLNTLKGYDLQALGHNSPEYLHLLVEATHMAFVDATRHVADIRKVAVPVTDMLSDSWASTRRSQINLNKAFDKSIARDLPRLPTGTDTVYFTVADEDGNACSFINSNYMGFGTGLVPKHCGFTLQNRGSGFSLEAGHPNVVASGKRPYHTIIPAMLTSDTTGELLSSYGVMGGYMQPQGHVQVLLNMLEFGMDPQTALNQPRYLVGDGHVGVLSGVTRLEEGISSDTMRSLRELGHDIVGPVTGQDRILFGRGHVITRGAWWARDASICKDNTFWWTGSDPRSDGVAMGY